MECRRAFEIDLGAYLRDPRARVWDDFRAHYPRCAACAAEVHAHTEVALLLAPEHPDPERLLRFEDAPASLAATERAAITTHLAGCLPCRDELSALRRFAPVLEEAPAAAAPRRAVVERRRWLPAFGEWLWQPAVAWAAVLMLVVYSTLGPASRGLFERTIPVGATKDELARDPEAPPADALKTRAPETPLAVQSAPHPKKTAAAAKNEAATAPPAGRRPDVEAKGDAERALAQRPTPSLRAGENGAATGALGGAGAASDERTRVEPRDGPAYRSAEEPRSEPAPSPAPPPAEPSREKALGYLEDSPRRRQAAPAHADVAPPAPPPSAPGADDSQHGLVPRQRVDGRLAPAESDDAAPRPSASAGAAAPPPPSPTPLAKEKLAGLDASQRLGAVAGAPPVGATLAARPDATDVAVLSITAPSPLPSEVEVELRAADGRRQLSERVTATARTITLSVAADWLEGGPYDVLVRDPSGRVLYTTRVQVRR